MISNGYLLRDYEKYQSYLGDIYDFITHNWNSILDDLNINYITASVGVIHYEITSTPTKLDLRFYLQTETSLAEDIIECIEKEACCKLHNHDEEICNGSVMRHFYTFKPLNYSTNNCVDDSWLRD